MSISSSSDAVCMDLRGPPEAAYVPHIPGRLWPGNQESLTAGLNHAPHISLEQVRWSPKEVPEIPQLPTSPRPRTYFLFTMLQELAEFLKIQMGKGSEFWFYP